RRIVAMGTLSRLWHATVRSRELEGPCAPAPVGIGVACRADSSRVPGRERASGPGGPCGGVRHRDRSRRGCDVESRDRGLSQTVGFVDRNRHFEARGLLAFPAAVKYYAKHGAGGTKSST